MIFRSIDEIEALKGKDMKDVSFLRVGKGRLTFEVPPALLGRMHYELLALSTLLQELEEVYEKGPQIDYDMSLTNYVDEKRIWQWA